MKCSEELLAILACPKCKGAIEPVNDHHYLACRTCLIMYPVRDGIPVMLTEEAIPLDEA